MRKTTLRQLLFLVLTTQLFVACAKQEKVSSIKAMETEKVQTQATYGQHTDEIQEFLSTTPLGSEIYLEEKESGEWYLRVEKTFTVQKDEKQTEMLEPIYSESILI